MKLTQNYELVVVAVRVTPGRDAPPIRVPLEHGRCCRTPGNEWRNSGFWNEQIRVLREEHV
jgi:hypothetical protein